jgi:DNA repair protein RadC
MNAPRAVKDLQAEEDAVILDALQILESRLKQPGIVLTVPEVVKNYLKLKLARLEHEVFGVLFLSTKNRLIADEEMFRGTLTHTSIYPREVVKTALSYNACSVVIYHNHPSGETTPSPYDYTLTKNLANSLKLVDVRLIDHIIVAGMSVRSFAENGEI